MIKLFDELTEQDKKRFLEDTKRKYEEQYGVPWDFVERQIQRFIDSAYDKELFEQMSSDDKKDAIYMKKKFPDKKPSIAEHVLWASTFVTGSEYVEIPD